MRKLSASTLPHLAMHLHVAWSGHAPACSRASMASLRWPSRAKRRGVLPSLSVASRSAPPCARSSMMVCACELEWPAATCRGVHPYRVLRGINKEAIILFRPGTQCRVFHPENSQIMT